MPPIVVAAGRPWCLSVDSVKTEGGDMKMMRWLAGIVILLLVYLFLLGTPPLRAAAAYCPTTSSDEHPWDKLTNAYRIQILIITEDYILLAVWYTKDQVQPVIIRIQLRPPDRISGSKTSYIFSD